MVLIFMGQCCACDRCVRKTPSCPFSAFAHPAQIPEERWDGVRDSVLQTLAASSSRSSKPQIFGAAPAPEPAAGSRRPIGSAAQVNRE